MWLIGLPVFLGLLCYALLPLAFVVWMFVDAVKNPWLSDTEKLLWGIGMIFVYPFVAIAYFFVARSSRNKPRREV